MCGVIQINICVIVLVGKLGTYCIFCVAVIDNSLYYTI